MNYRHAYHAGNFADVLKHVVLALVIEHLKLKPSPFRVIDTHAGIGAYDLGALEAQKTGEWRDGIGRVVLGEDLHAAPMPSAVAAVLAPYLAVVRAVNAEHAPTGDAAAGEAASGGAGLGLRAYPGSPLIARRLLRRGDVLSVNELHEADRQTLAACFAGDPQTRVLGIDGWTAVKSLLPPRERRGVVLIDPPFEQPGELARLSRALADALRRFATGTVLLWYPIKNPAPIAALHRDVAGLGARKLLAVELLVRAPTDPDRLNGAGLVVLNPPFTLAGKLELLLPWLSKTLAQDKHASGRVIELAGEGVGGR